MKVSSQLHARCVLLYGTHTHTHTERERYIYIYILNFHLQQILKVILQSMNGVCSCKATSGTLASTIFNFLNFQNHHEHVHNNLCKFYRSQTNGVCSCRERAPPGTPASTIFTFLNFQNHREHVYNNLCKFYRSQTNGVCSCRERATPGTPASTIFTFFKFLKPPRACLQ